MQPPSPDRIERALRAHFARHNLRVIVLALVTLVATAALWLILYGVCAWLIVLALAAGDAAEMQFPRAFPIVFGVVALGAVFYAWLEGRFTPTSLPPDEIKAGRVASDFLLAIPRMTLAIPGTLRAWQRLDDAECVLAAALLERLAEENRVPLQSVPLEIPDADARAKILFALQLTEVIDLRKSGREWAIALHPKRPPSLRLRAAR